MENKKLELILNTLTSILRVLDEISDKTEIQTRLLNHKLSDLEDEIRRLRNY